MRYLKRKIDWYLEEWRQDEHRKPLIVKGSRQIGKTESIRNFGEKHYENEIEINFVEEPKYKQIIADGYKTADLIRNISRIDPAKQFVEGKTLLFLMNCRSFRRLRPHLSFLSRTADLTSYAAALCWGFITAESRATALAIRRITRCIRLISRSFCGRRDTIQIL